MTYTKRRFGAELILELEKDFDINKLSHWAYEISWDVDDKDFNDILQKVIAINAGPEFELSKDELLSIAKKCILDEKTIVETF
ncbi:MAG: hypothetical protein NTW22_08005 [Proteobacteria bacterium]|nr:hypothetical protein [Pseudomonadota bacterium]